MKIFILLLTLATSVPAMAAEPLADTPTTMLSLDFGRGGEMKEFAAVFAKVLNRTINVDPSLTGRFYLSVKKEMSPVEAWRFFQKVVQQNGGYIVEESGVYFVRPQTNTTHERAVRPPQNAPDTPKTT